MYFRPINVPFKCKWLRESVRDLEQSLHILTPLQISAHAKAVFDRVSAETGFPQHIVNIANKIAKKLQD